MIGLILGRKGIPYIYVHRRRLTLAEYFLFRVLALCLALFRLALFRLALFRFVLDPPNCFAEHPQPPASMYIYLLLPFCVDARRTLSDCLRVRALGIGRTLINRYSLLPPPPPCATGNFSITIVDPAESTVAAAAHACNMKKSPAFKINEVFIVNPQEVPVPLAGIVGPVPTVAFGTVVPIAKIK